MAEHYSKREEEQEMDLQDLFKIIKRSFYGVVSLVFKAIDFFLKYWWAILLLAVLGAALGYFTKGSTKYSTTLIIKTNYDSQAYVYNAIEQFNNRLDADNNEAFLKELGLDLEKPEISAIAIAPIIDVIELLSNMPNDRTLTAVIKEIELEEDEAIFASEQFYSNFIYHKLFIRSRDSNIEEVLQAMVAYMNNQPQIKKIEVMSKANFLERIAINETSLRQIDDVIKVYTETVDFANKTAQETGFYNNENSLSIRELFSTKNDLTQENAELKNELATMEGSIYVVSDTQSKKEGSFLKSNSFLYAILLVGIFIVLAFIRYCYVTLRRNLEALKAE